MALNIKDPETDRLVRELAELNGESITSAVRNAVTRELVTARRRQAGGPDRRARIQEIIERGRARPLLDARSEAEILGYDQDGLPA